MNIKYALIWIILISLSACKKDKVEPNIIPKEGLFDVSKISPKIAEDWMDLFRTIVADEAINPPRAARVYAYASIAMYESVFEGIKGNLSLQGQLNGFEENMIPSNSDSLDFEIALNEAVSIVAKSETIVPQIKLSSFQFDLASINTLHDNILSQKVGVVQDSIIQKSIQRGKIVAKAIIDYAASDNFLSVKNKTYAVPARDINHLWYWEPTDIGHPIPVEPFWGQVRSFTLNSSNQFEIPQSVLFSTDTSSTFGRQAFEVYNTVNNRTNAQNDIVVWWRDATGTQTPSGHWMGILKYLFHIKDYKLDKAVELYTLTAITTADAFISCWDAKYKYNLLRPETYINNYIQSGWTTGQNSDITPPFPEYPSGHSVCSGAAAKVLTAALGTVTFTDSINTNIGYMPRTFSSFDSAANEAAISRLYGGIHYREAIDKGLQQGKNVGQWVLDNIHFRL